MLAKLTSKNQLTLPKSVTKAVGASDYFDVQAKGGQIILTPVRIQRAGAVRAKLAEIDITDKDIADAVHSLIGTCKFSFEGRQDTIDYVHSLSKKLEVAQKTDDINILRSIIQEESKRAREVLVRHEKEHRELQSDFDDSIKALEGKLTSVEGSGSRDYLTECASRGALDFYLSKLVRDNGVIVCPDGECADMHIWTIRWETWAGSRNSEFVM